MPGFYRLRAYECKGAVGSQGDTEGLRPVREMSTSRCAKYPPATRVIALTHDWGEFGTGTRVALCRTGFRSPGALHNGDTSCKFTDPGVGLAH